jgi:acetolactate synthase-1/2/3 large subunit
MGSNQNEATQMPGGHVVCEALINEGVEVVFGIPGGAVLPLYDSLWHYPQIRHILMRHEQGAAHAAEAYARVTGQPGVCIATSGPGATNLITGLAAAKLDSTPVVAITGQVARNFMGTEAFQECDTIGMSRPLLKKTYQVLNPKDIAATIHEAFHAAREGRPGPVLVDIPKDVQAEITNHSMSMPVQNHPSGHTRPAAEVLEAAATMLNEAERPLLIVGHGVHLSQAWHQLRAIAEAANVPVVNTIHGTGAFPRHHPLALGMLGMHGMYWSNMATAEADLIIGIGMRFDDRVTGRPGTFAPNARIIHLEIEPRQVSKNVRADLALIGDAKVVLSDLLPLVASRPRYAWHKRLSELQRDHPSIGIPDTHELTPQFVLAELNKVIQSSADPIIATGVGQHQMWAAQFLFLDNPRSFITSGGLGVMGFEVPAAIGAKVGRPEADVWSVAG